MKKIFDDMEIITDGKFVGVVKNKYTYFKFFFGIYNHKYFSFLPPYNNVCVVENYREATTDEIETFLKDCKNLGYEWNHSMFYTEDNKFVSYPLMTKADFLNMRMPMYVPFDSFMGKTVVNQFKWHDYMIWIFSDKTYTKVQIRGDVEDRDYVDFYDSDTQSYDKPDTFPGEEMIDMWDANRYFAKVNINDTVIDSRASWWYFASNCVNYNFYNITTIEDLDEQIDNKDFTDFGKAFIEADMIDVKYLRMLLHEYFYYNQFQNLVAAIRQKEEYEKKIKQNNGFDII